MPKLETGFLPIENKQAQILILGSMPSVQSLAQQQYYAHPRNAFWPIMSTLFNMAKDWTYEQRCDALVAHKIAVWDALKACQRQGSLDSNIDPTSMIANDFSVFLHAHPNIKMILFNGGKAEQVFNRYALPLLDMQQAAIVRHRLPSTSPAHAALNFEQKRQAWQQVLKK